MEGREKGDRLIEGEREKRESGREGEREKEREKERERVIENIATYFLV